MGVLLGNVLGGFNQAHEQDMQRQFADLQSRRAMAGELLSQIALDPNQHPDVRNAALQSRLGLSQEKPGTDFNMKKWFEPIYNMIAERRTQAAQGAQQQAPASPQAAPAAPQLGMPPVPPNAPALVAQGPPTLGPLPVLSEQSVTPPPALTASQQMMGRGQEASAPMVNAPPPPPAGLPIAAAGVAGAPASTGGLLATVPEIARNTGMMAGAQAAGQTAGTVGTTLDIHRQIAERLMADPRYAEMIKNDPMMRNMLLSAQLGVTMPYGMYAANMAGPSTTLTAGQARADQTLAGLVPANIPDNSPVKVTRNRMGAPQSITEELVPSVLPKTTTEGTSTTTPGGLTTTKRGQRTVTPQMPGGGAAGGVKVNAPPAPTGAAGAGRAGASRMAPAVSAAMDNIMLYGMPAGKTSDAQALALQEMKRQGINPQIAATMATRTMADKGRMILPLIAKARELIAKDPKSLGPLSGRWSELQQRVGNLEGAPKELAGVLTSIYSMAGGLHGWRAIQVAERFREQYGDLTNTPASLLSGLAAMEQTAHVAMQTGYPGMSEPPSPEGQKSVFEKYGGAAR